MVAFFFFFFFSCTLVLLAFGSYQKNQSLTAMYPMFPADVLILSMFLLFHFCISVCFLSPTALLSRSLPIFQPFLSHFAPILCPFCPVSSQADWLASSSFLHISAAAHFNSHLSFKGAFTVPLSLPRSLGSVEGEKRLALKDKDEREKKKQTSKQINPAVKQLFPSWSWQESHSGGRPTRPRW